ncbi:MAG: DNA polymerase III subunit delta [Culicoidibacterales bacterium]
MSVHIILGEDRYLTETTITTLCQQAGLARDDFGVMQGSLLEQSLQDIIQDANTTSLFAERKVIIARDAYCFTGKRVKQTFDGEHQLAVLERYLQHPNPETVLIFVVPAEKFDERKKVVKALKQLATVHLAQPLNDKQLHSWLEQQLINRQLQFEAIAKQALLTRCDFQLEMLVHELDKYQLYGKQERYTVGDVEMLTPDNLQSDIFQFIDALLLKKFFLAQKQLDKYLQEGEDVFGVIALVANQLKLLLQVKALHDSGLNPQTIASRLGVHPYRVKLALEKSRQHAPQLVMQTLTALTELDVQVKQGQMDKKLGFELFMIRFCQ